MGRKNHLSCWTEVGAEHLAVLHSLLVTGRLQGVDACACLVDVLQRVGQHPAREAAVRRLGRLSYRGSPPAASTEGAASPSESTQK